jgi:hypothetical protein
LLGAFVGIMALLIISHNASAKNFLLIPPSSEVPITKLSSVDEILALMLDSDQKWDTMQAEYQLSQMDPNTKQITSQETQKFWLSDKGAFARVEIVGEKTNKVFVRDETKFHQENLDKATFYQREIPGTFQLNDYNPRELIKESTSVVYLHPYAKALPTAYYDFLYPTAIAQGLISNIANKLETITVVGEETIAGRNTIIIQRLPKNHLYWVDCQTGVILKAQYIGDSETWQTQFESINIDFDKDIAASEYNFTPSENSKEISAVDFFENSLPQ